MNANILGIYIDPRPGYFILNVAVKTSEGTYKAFYGRQDGLSNYAVDRIISNGKLHNEESASEIFPIIDDHYDYDSDQKHYEEQAKAKISLLSDKYERAKDCLNFLTVANPEEQRLVIETHDILRELSDELAQSYKA